MPTESVLNTVYAQVPFSTGGINDGCPASGAVETACKDAVDNDADTLINDGCAQVGRTAETGTECANDIDDDADTTFVAQTQLGGSPITPPASLCLDTPQTSESVTEVYNNPPLLGDEDNDGKVNDGCAAVDTAENAATQCADSDDDDADTVVNDGCVAVGAAETVCGNTSDTDNDGKNDGNGLYARWTILQSMGSTHLAKAGDLRMVKTLSPSLPSDTGYVERIIDLQCFWIDEDGGAPADADGVISEVASWQDQDLLDLSGIDVCDTDRDCLIDAACAQPGQPVDTDDLPNGAPLCPVLQYSANPKVVQYDTAADTDCDGLVDGVEYAYGSDPELPDSDDDGAPDFVEMFQFTNPLVQDTDGDGLLDKPEDDYVAAAASSAEAGEAVNFDDNCPTVANATQANNDGKRRINPRSGTLAGTPNQDKLGDACDPDDDNDYAVDSYEIDTTTVKVVTDPLNEDTDCDTVQDSAEYRLGPAAPPANPWPTNTNAKPAWAALQQVYYKGCHINVNAAYAGFAVFIGDPPPPNPDGAEMDPDGDGVACPTDFDSDNAAGPSPPGHAIKDEITDAVEAFGYGTGIAAPDSDGDGCEDWIEISDLNGDRRADVGDNLLLAERKAALPPLGAIAYDCVLDRVFDVDKNKRVDVGDQLQEALNTCNLKNWGGCMVCPSEN
ncbi:MAG: hypothetical protein MUP15_06070 [Dehalococcoidia bacterium]|nr:hypothetical protein [Dehalococcoidia bacterium]